MKKTKIVLAVLAFGSCAKKTAAGEDGKTVPAGNTEQGSEAENASDAIPADAENASDAIPADAENPVVTMEMEDGGVITMELYYDKAPNTVKNFISLVKSGFYDGLTFHRVIPGFMIQGGDPEGTGFGDPGYSIKGEFAANGFAENDLKHLRGTLSMARSTPPDTAGSQFFICVTDYPSLDGSYAAFGRVTDGMDVADRIVSVERDASDKPLEDVVIKSMTVDTKGVDYGEPVTMK